MAAARFSRPRPILPLMTSHVAPATPYWQPDEDLLRSCGLTHYRDWLLARGEDLGAAEDSYDYDALWRWSVEDVDRFWLSLLDYFDVPHGGEQTPVRRGADMLSTEWFPNVELNYVEQIFRHAKFDATALVCVRESGAPAEITWRELRTQVASVQQVLAKAGVTSGDRVVGFLPNTEHAIVCFLAAAGLGAVWSSCSPDFGVGAVVDRFEQIEPKVLVACRGYGYGGKYQDRTAVIAELAERLASVKDKVLVDLAGRGPLDGWLSWESLPAVREDAFVVTRVPFGHPLWILYSSGTTGKPKAIVHSHGGCLLEHLKYLSLQADVRPGERFFWFTTTGWMMWNFLQASMLVGAVPVLFDGSPGYPGLGRLWRLAAELPIHHFGTSAPFLQACRKAGISVADELDLGPLRSIGSTGAPLSADGFTYVSEHIKAGVWLTSMSGGTDVCTAFVGGNPWSAVHRGWIQGRALGCDLHAFGEDHRPVIDQEGELVVRQAMPSMPIGFVGDADDSRRRESYFEDIPGLWRHGDWIEVNGAGEVFIYGRSDATLNRQGVRIGTAEIYRWLDAVPEVADALIINYVDASGEDHMPLYLVMAAGRELSDGFRQNLKRGMREGLSPRHVPTRIEAVAEIPYTISGKRLETPIKRLFERQPLEKVANLGALRNPDALREFAHLAARKRDDDVG